MPKSFKPPPSDLQLKAAQLLARLGTERTTAVARVQELESAIREADTWQHRRAARNERDNRTYRLGAAFEPQGGLDLDDLFVSGMDVLGAAGLLLLTTVALKAPTDASLSDLLRRLSRTPAGATVRSWGVWARWHWLRRMYDAEVLAFEQSPAGTNPRATWRKKRPTWRQQYMSMELARFLQLVPPEFVTSEEAHDWLFKLNGNPRFQQYPQCPAMPTVEDLGL